MRKTIFSVALVALVGVAGVARASFTPTLGQIILYSGTFAPRGWMYCEGQTLSISEHQALFSIVRNTYGGDSRTTFKLPNLRSAEAKLKGLRFLIAIKGTYPRR